jgi:hypothetical protein
MSYARFGDHAKSVKVLFWQGPSFSTARMDGEPLLSTRPAQPPTGTIWCLRIYCSSARCCAPRSVTDSYRSSVASTPKFRILKIHRAETRPGNLDLRGEVSDIPRQRPDSWPLTSGNVASSQSAAVSNSNRSLQGVAADRIVGASKPDFARDWRLRRQQPRRLRRPSHWALTRIGP